MLLLLLLFLLLLCLLCAGVEFPSPFDLLSISSTVCSSTGVGLSILITVKHSAFPPIRVLGNVPETSVYRYVRFLIRRVPAALRPSRGSTPCYWCSRLHCPACSVSRSWNSVSDTTAVVRQSAGITNALHIDVGAVVLGLRHSARPVGDGDGAPGELEPDPDAADGDDTSINAEQSPDLLKNDARARRVDMGGRDGDSEFVRLASNTSVTEPVTSTAGDSERRWDDAMPWLTLGNGDDAAPVSSCSRTSTVSSKHQVMQLGHGRRNSS